MLKIEVISKTKENFDFNPKQAKADAKNICENIHYAEKSIVEVFFISNNEIKQLNSKFRDIDNVTDVLSFPLNDSVPGQNKILGTVFIAPIFAGSENISCNDLFIHGLLHLFGFDHEKDLKSWQNIEKSI